MSGQLLDGLLASVPPDANPYAALLNTVARLVVPTASKGGAAFWILDSVILALNALLGVAVLAGKLRRGDLYWFKRRTLASGTVYIPNAGMLFTVFASSFAIVAQPYIHMTMIAQEADQVETAALRVQTGVLPIVFTCLALAFFSELQAMCIMMYLAHKQTVARILSPRIFNTLFASFYIVVISALITLFSISYVRWTQLLDVLSAVSKPLAAASKTWQPGQTLDASKLVEVLPYLDKIEQRSDAYVSITQAGYSVLLGIVIIIVSLYIPAGLSYISLLHNRMRFSLTRSKQDQAFTGSTTSSISIAPYRLMISKALVVFLASVCAGVSSGWLACDFTHVVTSTTRFAIVNQLCFFTFALLACIILALLAYSTWQTDIERLWSRLGRRKSAQQVHLRRQTRAHYDMSFMDINVAIEMVVVEEVDHEAQTVRLPKVSRIPVEEEQEKSKAASLEESP